MHANLKYGLGGCYFKLILISKILNLHLNFEKNDKKRKNYYFILYHNILLCFSQIMVLVTQTLTPPFLIIYCLFMFNFIIRKNKIKLNIIKISKKVYKFINY